MKVFKIITKTLRLILRSKTSLAAVLLGPLLIITLVGLAFGNMNQYSLNIGVFAHEYDELVESYLDMIQNDTTFKISRYPLIDLCLNDIKRGSTHTCIEFPRGFDLGVPGANEIKFYVDQSKSDILAIVRTIVINRLSERTAQIASEQTGDVLQRVDLVNNIINQEMVVLTEISDLSSRFNQDMLRALERVEELNEFISQSAESVHGIDNKFKDVVKYITDLRNAALSAASEIENSTLGFAKEESILDLYNDTDSLNKEIANLISAHSSVRTSMFNQGSAIRSDIESVQSEIGSLFNLINGVRSSFAEATGNFDGIDVGGAENLTAPIRTRVEPVVSEQAPLNYMFPTLLVLMITLVSVMLAGTLVVIEKTSSSFFRNFVTPTANITFIAGIFFTNVLVTLAQTVLILLVSTFVFGGAVLTNFATIFVSLFIIASLFTLIGMFLGYLFSTQEMVSLSGITVSSLFMLLSGILVPLEQMPEYMINLSRYNPLLLGESILRKAIIFETPIFNEAMMREIFIILAFTIIMLVVVVITQRIKKEMFLSGPNFLRRKKVFSDDDINAAASGKSGSSKQTEKKKLPGLDFLEDYTGFEDENASKKGKSSKGSSILSKVKGLFGITKKEEIVFSGDEEFEESSKADKSLDGMKSSGDSEYEKKNQGSVSKYQEDSDEDEGEDSDDDDGDDDEGSSPSGRNKGKSSKGKSSSTSKRTKKDSSKDYSEDFVNDNELSLLNKHLEPHQYFVLSSGNIVKSFAGLIDELKTMDAETFGYHVGDDRNDFYLWIKNVLKSDSAASKIRRVYDPKKMAKILRKFL